MEVSEHEGVTEKAIDELQSLSICTLSDALDRRELSGVVLGIRPTRPDCPRIT